MEDKDLELQIKELEVKKERTKLNLLTECVVLVCLVIALVFYLVSMFVDGPTEFKWYHALFFCTNPVYIGVTLSRVCRTIGILLDIDNNIWELKHPELVKETNERIEKIN